jgi:hypothetical protein
VSFIPDSAERTVHIPVVIRDGNVQFFGGGPLPAIRNGAVADLVVSAWAVLDESWRRLLGEERRIPLLGKGTRLLVELNPSGDHPGGLRGKGRGSVLKSCTICLEPDLRQKSRKNTGFQD